MPRRPAGMRRAPWLSAVLLTALVAGAACTGGGRTAPKDSKVLDMLSLVPSTKSTRRVVLVNLYTKAAEEAKVDRPKPGASERTLFRYLMNATNDRKTATFLAPSDLAYPSNVLLGKPKGLGFTVLDMDADVQAGFGSGGVQLARGHFDKERIHDRITHYPRLKGRVVQETHHGATYDRWSGAAGLVSGSGEGRIALPDDDTMLYASSEKEMSLLIDVAKADRRSLADEPDYREAARALDGRDVFAAAFMPGRRPLRTGRGPSTSRSSTRHGVTPNLVATGLARGPGKGDKAGKAELVIVYVNADERAAQDNAKRLEETATTGRSAVNGQDWRKVLQVKSVTNEGRLTIGVFSTERGSLWRDLPQRFDPLVMPG